MTEEFLDRIRAYSWRVARNRGMSLAEADDAAQEAVLTVWRRDGSYDADNPAGLSEWSWYSFVARGAVSLYWLRKIHGNRHTPVGDIAEDAIVLLNEPEEAGLAAWEAVRVREAVAQLREPDRTVVGMILEDKTPAEIAEAMGWDAQGGRVRQIRRRAFAALAPQLEEVNA